MPDLGDYLTAAHDENAGQLTPVRAGAADAATPEDGGAEPRQPHARMRELEERALFEPELPVEGLVGIADANDIADPVLLEPGIGVFRRRHVHERNLRSRRLDGRSITGDVGQRFAAERSAEVAQEDEEHRPVRLQGTQRLGQGAVIAGEGHESYKLQVQSSKWRFNSKLRRRPHPVFEL